MIAWTQTLAGTAGQVTLATTDREGGRSAGPWGAADGRGGLNLATHVQDDPAHVRANRELLADALGAPPDHLVVADQVHGRDVVEVSGPCAETPVADALVTTRAGVVLTVLVADCVPVMLADAEHGVVAVAHAGRPGLVAGVVGATVAAMRDLGARDVVARLGPSICPRCYEVPLALREQVAEHSPVSRSVTWVGRPAVDVAAGVLAELDALGVPALQLPGCTVQSPELYSYRRDGVTGRFAGLAWLGAPDAA